MVGDGFRERNSCFFAGSAANACTTFEGAVFSQLSSWLAAGIGLLTFVFVARCVETDS
jgi:hypothetical protein